MNTHLRYAQEFRDIVEVLARGLPRSSKARREAETKIESFDRDLAAWNSEHAPKQVGMFAEPERKKIVSRPYVSGSPTSLRAANSVTQTDARTQKARIFAAIQGAYRGLTDDEIGRVTGIGPSTVRPRRGELVTEGEVFDSKLTRESDSGEAMTVWKARL